MKQIFWMIGASFTLPGKIVSISRNDSKFYNQGFLENIFVKIIHLFVINSHRFFYNYYCIFPQGSS